MSAPSSPTSSGLLTALQKQGFRFLLWRGVLGILVGLLLIVSPFGSATVFGVIVGAWMVVDGLSTAGLSLDLRRQDAPWGWVMADGVIQVLFGVLVLLVPVTFAVVSAFFVLGFLAIGMILSGIVQLTTPAPARTGWSVVVGIVNVVFGIVLGVLAVTDPVDNVVALSWMAGISAIALGVSLTVAAVRIRNLGR